MVFAASACCCGATCRWHGKKTSKTTAIRRVEAEGHVVIPVCPEMLGGLPCPREPVSARKGRIIGRDTGIDFTATFQAGAAEAVRIAKGSGASYFMGFKLSPSCALRGIAGRWFERAGIEVIPIY